MLYTIRFPQIFQRNNDVELINFDYQIKIDILNNHITIYNQEYASSSNKILENKNQLLSIFSKILSQINQKQLLNDYNLFKYEFTCLAGTFDHCHIGHLFLFQSSLALSKPHYFIGVCSDEMIKHKGHLSLIQSNFIRRKKIEEIINLNGYNKNNCLYEI